MGAKNLRSVELMMRAYGTQVIRFRANLFVHEPPVAGYIDARISVIGMVQFVVVE